MNKAILLIGGNLGNRTENLQQAVMQIDKRAGKVEKKSGLYETAAWGHVQQPDYLNQALQISTALEAEELLETVLDIERQLGRVRQQKWGARIIDIDIIFFNDAVIDLPDLRVPHPQMANRQFVLVPLAEISPDWIHPILHKDVSALLAACTDTLPAHKYQLQEQGR
ncbi:2-amino-4-hydroxy-6-hydroxymethyldihydropteridine diphosphokinase [Chitinophaga sancti]|uniref:2-amino-4-hydroxy-6-hydroxymethyldihydropteridine pyrophosphokinase n=1 Tax=Chitinophaga sancti TaxID=1004 RepID=A0A1K1RPX4_9BACT|nr:2-amino-4-hydroxy-6-hydroxymethyldihydropteridine diphosphokinase [Chitinophaga sancti]WQD62488.1 2-amino-4-hydroxy-6-hydroxymethyldihydropteridine diphosphokinase [Chitinophaga sancti]WQG91943.1 2-amino-4-hydroxy-6-hydroxymethyldihydropteridine diphosphokinase [Chitinophaga sancti]SFW74331.1 2-amino-4-hydroxy-6-hydroxymethyldihydropteridinediphosphokinase [Chitinophaga sancti]